MRQIIGDSRFPVAEKLAREVLSLPVHPKLSAEDLEKIVAEVNKL
jgi:dTDP-4-amino-4,6-dideoxygalactose transaminase